MRVYFRVCVFMRARTHTRGWGCLTDASMRKELYFYIPGGRLDDVYSILNVTYWREEGGRESCDERIKIQGNHGAGQKFTAAIGGRTHGALSHRVFFSFACLSGVTPDQL